MTKHKRLHTRALAALVITAALFSAAAPAARADDPDFDAITRHLKSHFNARRVSIPFLGLANFFVKVVRPAGVKSVKVAIFENLDFAQGQSASAFNAVMRSALSPEWQPLIRVRSRDGGLLHVYAREAGENIKLMVVTINQTDAVVARVKLSPKRLADFLRDPKILGISINR
ncbi:MAG TPA: hypothetical protein VN256_01430 [Pyrinomonadaceae bacterium]|nr:hypothetical protein [Pyrinomonadaceae bacterium]